MVASLALDYERRSIGVVLNDRRIVSAPLKVAMAPDFVARTSYDLRTDEVTISFREGERFAMEAGDRASLDGRPIVYLDQNHWVELARFRYAPDKVHPAERAACEGLSTLAESGKIVLPLSGGHAVETARTDGRWRHDLGMTMLRLSRGWQMLSPLKVRALELGSDIAGAPMSQDGRASIITLTPDSLFVETCMHEPEVSAALPALPRHLLRRLHWNTLFAELLLEDEISDEGRGPELADGWARTHDALAQYMHTQRIPREHARINAHACVLSDFRADLTQAASEAGLTQPEFDQWLEGLRTGMGQMPYIGRVEQLIYHRLRNAQAAWERNDLNDVHFLCCAAGYADVVVCENETADHLNRAARLAPPGAAVCSSLAAGWEALQALLDG
jgi:hypothetical protein